MSLIEPHLSDIRAGFGGFGFSSRLGSGPMLPLWRPTPTPAVSYCTNPTCPCTLPRPYIMSDMYDYPGFSYSWAAWYYKTAQDPLYKSLPPLPPPPPIERRDILDHRESPSKELPTKAHKQERIKERVELSQTLNFDKDHTLKLRQVCTGTQTQISSVSPPNHYRTEESSSSETYVYHHLLPQTVSSHQNLRNSPPQYAHSDLHSPHDAPLNLSLTNSSVNSNSPSQSRPSVITCAPVTTNGRYENGSNRSPSPSSRRDANSADICDQDIEEHFRRSLGKNYSEYLTKPATTPSPPQPAMLPSPPPPPPPAPPTLPPLPPYHSVVPTLITNSVPGGKENPNVSITGSVDDHFARALGNRTWSELKAKNDVESTQPGSVDDHFAKALGETWLKIKAEKESSRPNHPFPIAHQLPHPHPLPHPIPHPHPHVLPLPQRSSPPTTQHSTSLLST